MNLRPPIDLIVLSAMLACMACSGTVDGPELDVLTFGVDGVGDPDVAPEGDPSLTPGADQDAPPVPGDTAEPPPIRAIAPALVLIHTSHGTFFENWVGDTDRYDFTLGPELAALARYRDRMVILDGFDGPNPAGFAGAHHWGPAYVFSGEVVTLESTSGPRAVAARPSLDWLVDSGSYLRSLVTARADFSLLGGPEFGCASASAPAPTECVAPETNLQAIFTRLFGNLDAPPARIVELEHLVATADPGDMTARARLHAKLIANALGLELTRAAVFHANFVHERTEQVAPSSGVANVNALAHDAMLDTATRAAYDAYRREVALRVAALVDELATTPHGPDTVLDHSLVIWVDDTGFGNPSAHDYRRLPILWLAGSKLPIAAGQYLRYPGGRPYADMLRTAMDALGVDRATLGAPLTDATPLPELVP